jgi:hypothetical protein
MALTFRTELELHGKTATGLTVPAEIVDQLSGGKRVAVVVKIAKHSYRTTVAPMGGKFLIPVSAENREAAGVSAGDVVDVTVAADEAPREVEVPDDLSKAIGAKGFSPGLLRRPVLHPSQGVGALGHRGEET